MSGPTQRFRTLFDEVFFNGSHPLLNELLLQPFDGRYVRRTVSASIARITAAATSTSTSNSTAAAAAAAAGGGGGGGGGSHTERMMHSMLMSVLTDENVVRKHNAIRLISAIVFLLQESSFESLARVIAAHHMPEYFRKLIDVLVNKTVDEENGSALVLKSLALLCTVECARITVEQQPSLQFLSSRPLGRLEVHLFLMFCASCPSVIPRYNTGTMHRFLAREWEYFLEVEEENRQHGDLASPTPRVPDSPGDQPAASSTFSVEEEPWYYFSTWPRWLNFMSQKKAPIKEKTPVAAGKEVVNPAPSLVVMYHLPPLVAPELLSAFESVVSELFVSSQLSSMMALCKLALHLVRLLIDSKHILPSYLWTIFDVWKNLASRQLLPSSDLEPMRLTICIFHQFFLSPSLFSKLEHTSPLSMITSLVAFSEKCLAAELDAESQWLVQLDIVAALSAFSVYGGRIFSRPMHEEGLVAIAKKGLHIRTVYLRLEAIHANRIEALERVFYILFNMEKHFVGPSGAKSLLKLHDDRIATEIIAPRYEGWLKDHHVVPHGIGGVWSMPNPFRAVPSLCRQLTPLKAVLDVL
eukprot:ANDGO_04298.mRNA.1 hypothetical protein